MSKNEEILKKFIEYNKFQKEDGQSIMSMNLDCKLKLDESIRGLIDEKNYYKRKYQELKQKQEYYKMTVERDCDEEFEL